MVAVEDLDQFANFGVYIANGEGAVSAVIDFLCAASHERRESGVVTVVDGHWAYCGQGGVEDHDWRPIPATSMSDLMAMGPHARQDLVTREDLSTSTR